MIPIDIIISDPLEWKWLEWEWEARWLRSLLIRDPNVTASFPVDFCWVLYGHDLGLTLLVLSIRLLQLFLLDVVSDLMMFCYLSAASIICFLLLIFLVLLTICLKNSFKIESLVFLWAPVRNAVQMTSQRIILWILKKKWLSLKIHQTINNKITEHQN